MDHHLTLTSTRCLFRTRHPGDAAALARYYARNDAHLAPWEPLRPAGYNSPEAWQARLEAEAKTLDKMAANTPANTPAKKPAPALFLIALRRDGPDEVVAICNFSNIVYGVFDACHLGFSLDQAEQGQGLMQEVLETALDHAFNGMKLHRVMANHLPENHRSAALLQRLGFEEEGYARSYLKIAGRWRDHVLRSLLHPDHADTSREAADQTR